MDDEEIEAAVRPPQYDPFNFGFVEIGTLLGAHGVRGECKLRLSTDYPQERLPSGRVTRHLRRVGRVYPRPVQVCNGRPASQPGQWIFRLDGVQTREEAVALRGATLYIRADERYEEASAGEMEYTVADWIDREVVLRDDLDRLSDEQGDAAAAIRRLSIGRVVGVVLREEMGGAHDLLDVLLYRGKKQLYVPFVRELVQELPDRVCDGGPLDPGAAVVRSMVLTPPPGLLELAKRPRRYRPPRIRGLILPAKEGG